MTEQPQTDSLQQQAADLAAQIEHHRGLYARGVPELVDADYDALEERLRELLTANPDVDLDDNPLERPWSPELVAGQTIRHSRPMLSLEKATTKEQLDAFVARFPGQAFRVTPKLDGISLAVAYRDGAIDYVATRGDGRDGERVTEKAQLVVLGLPLQLEGTEGRIEVRGEAVMLRSVFDAYNDTHPDRPLVNPRNAAAGTLVHKSPQECVARGRGRQPARKRFDLFASAFDRVTEIIDAARFTSSDLPIVLDLHDEHVAVREGIARNRKRVGERPGLDGGADFHCSGAVSFATPLDL